VISVTSGAGVDGEATGVSLPLLLYLVIAMVHNMHFYDLFRSRSFGFINPRPHTQVASPRTEETKNKNKKAIYLP